MQELDWTYVYLDLGSKPVSTTVALRDLRGGASSVVEAAGEGLVCASPV